MSQAAIERGFKGIYTTFRQKIFQGKKLDTLYKEAKRFNRK